MFNVMKKFLKDARAFCELHIGCVKESLENFIGIPEISFEAWHGVKYYITILIT